MDYKKLEVERARMAVSVSAAKSLVAKWMGADAFELEDKDPVAVLAPKPQKINKQSSEALARLEKRRPKPERLAARPKSHDSDSDSRSTFARKKKRAAAALDSYKSRKKR